MVFYPATYGETLSWSDTNPENIERRQLIDEADP